MEEGERKEGNFHLDLSMLVKYLIKITAKMKRNCNTSDYPMQKSHKITIQLIINKTLSNILETETLPPKYVPSSAQHPQKAQKAKTTRS